VGVIVVAAVLISFAKIVNRKSRRKLAEMWYLGILPYKHKDDLMLTEEAIRMKNMKKFINAYWRYF